MLWVVIGIVSFSTSAEAVIEGYYHDLFMDGGANLTSRTTLPAASYLGLSMEYIATSSITEQNSIMVQMDDGDWQDDNGALLYPDGEPRFRCIYTNGGSAAAHGVSLGETGRQRVRDFYYNGGGYSGSCAGAFIASTGTSVAKPDYYHIWPGRTNTTSLGGAYTGMDVPPGSPLLDYYDFGGDNYIASVYHNGGCYVIEGDSMYWAPGTEVLATYALPVETDDTSWDEDLLGNTSCWARREDSNSGRVVPIGSHPEGVSSGERRDLMAAILQYAMDGQGSPNVKAALEKGVSRQMNDNSTAGHEKIGDLQYHHFTVELPDGMARLTITLDGDDAYDLNLYMKKDDFAFEGEPGVIEAVNGLGADEILTIENPSGGTWYTAVKCSTTVTSVQGAYPVYSGALGVLNGVAYTITAEWNGPNGDLTYDGKVDGNDMRKLSLHWLESNRHYIEGDGLIGWWEFDEGNGNTAADSSGYDNTGTLYDGNGNVIEDPNWQSGALVFDANTYVQTAYNANKLQLTGSYTWLAWIKADSNQTEWAAIFDKYDPNTAGPGNNHWSLQFGAEGYIDTSGKIVVWNGPDAFDFWDTEIELSEITGDWHHIAVVRSMTMMMSYLDGQMVACSTYTTNPISGAGLLNIGADRRLRNFYKGLIDDVQIYDYQFTSDEVRQLSLEHPVGQLVGWWNFDDGTADDNSGNDHHGTLTTGDATTSVNIVYDADRDSNVLELNNPVGHTINSVVDCGGAGGWAEISARISIAAWLKVDTFHVDNHHLLTKGNGYQLTRNGTTDAMRTKMNGLGALGSSTSVNDGNWHHVAVTYDSNSSKRIIYIDGLPSAIDTPSGLLNDTDVDPFVIGGRLNSSYDNRGWDGRVDDVRLYDYALSPSAVEWLYEGSPAPEPVGYLCFEKPIGDMNGDCKVDHRDFNVLASNWLESNL